MISFTPEQRLERVFHRVAYVLHSMWEEDGRSYDTRILDEPLIPRGYVIVGESLQGTERREHVVPRDAICRECVKMFSEGASLEKVAEFIRDHLKIVRISLEEKNHLDGSAGLNLQRTMPIGWKVGDNVFARLQKAGIKYREVAPNKPLHATREDAGA